MKTQRINDIYVLILIILVIGLDVSGYYICQNPFLQVDRVLMWGICSSLTLVVVIASMYHFNVFGK